MRRRPTYRTRAAHSAGGGAGGEGGGGQGGGHSGCGRRTSGAGVSGSESKSATKPWAACAGHSRTHTGAACKQGWRGGPAASERAAAHRRAGCRRAQSPKRGVGRKKKKSSRNANGRWGGVKLGDRHWPARVRLVDCSELWLWAGGAGVPPLPPLSPRVWRGRNGGVASWNRTPAPTACGGGRRAGGGRGRGRRGWLAPAPPPTSASAHRHRRVGKRQPQEIEPALAQTRCASRCGWATTLQRRAGLPRQQRQPIYLRASQWDTSVLYRRWPRRHPSRTPPSPAHFVLV